MEDIMKISILTATYNRIDSLSRLYDSLLKQANSQFEWVIIDDGSSDDTEKNVKMWRDRSGGFVIRYYKKNNGGKSRAINYGLSECQLSDFVLIVDDDEELYQNAVDIIENYVNKYLYTNCVGMEFLRNDKNKQPIANYYPKEDLVMSVQERKKKNYEIDGYTGYFIKKLGNRRFPEFEGEKYVGPGVLQMISSSEYDLVWPCVALGETEYLQGGITSQGRKLRIRNPKGMIIYCDLLQNKQSGIRIRIKYSIMGYAYSAFIDDKTERRQFLKECHYFKFCYFPGLLLGAIWGSKYKE